MTAIISQEVKEKMNAALKHLELITDIKIKTEQEFNNATSEVKKIKKMFNEFEKERKLIVKPINDQISEINNEFKAVTVPLKNGENIFKIAIDRYNAEQQRIIREKQAKAEAEAEAERIKAEAKAEAEAEKARKYEEQGKDELAEKARIRAEAQQEKAQTIVAPVIKESKIQGLSFRTEYELKILDKKKAVESLMSSPFTDLYVTIDTMQLKKLVASRKGIMNIDGIEIIEHKKSTIRA